VDSGALADRAASDRARAVLVVVRQDLLVTG
jgi:hypothetical protein